MFFFGYVFKVLVFIEFIFLVVKLIWNIWKWFEKYYFKVLFIVKLKFKEVSNVVFLCSMMYIKGKKSIVCFFFLYEMIYECINIYNCSIENWNNFIFGLRIDMKWSLFLMMLSGWYVICLWILFLLSIVCICFKVLIIIVGFFF